MLLLGDERRVGRMVGGEEVCALREDLKAVDVPERSAQRQRHEQGEHGGADETSSHVAEVYAPGRFRPYFTAVIAR